MNKPGKDNTSAEATVLVVDDDEICRTSLSNLMESSGLRTVSATSGAHALELTKTSKFDVVLLALVMPGIDGIEVCRRLKMNSETAHIPVIIVTSMDEREARIKSIRAGADEFVTKPYDAEEIALRVHNAVRMKRLHDQSEAQVAKLEETERLRDNMTNMIVHDMINPLSAVLIGMRTAEECVEPTVGGDDRKVLQLARESAECLSEMISSMLDICRIESGSFVPDKVRCSIVGLILDSIKHVGGVAAAAPIDFTKPDPDIEVSADADLIKRVMMNLLQNARKYTPSKGSIEISVSALPGLVRVAVKDTGVGIAKEHHQKIFEKFGQVGPGDRSGRRSPGLGLTFCKMAVEAHGGTIGLESEAGQGSTFYFTLPLEPRDRAESTPRHRNSGFRPHSVSEADGLSVEPMTSEGQTHSVSARFSASAATYDSAAGVQLGAALKLMTLVQTVDQPDQVLDIGCGTGLLTQLVADHFTKAGIEAIDVATEVVEIARRRFAGNKRVQCVVADGMTYRSHKPFPLIVSNSSLHWITPLDMLFENISRLLAPGGHVVFSMMIKGTLAELHESRLRVARGKPAKTSLPTFRDVSKALSGGNLVITNSQSENIRTEYPSVTDFLLSLHNTGVTGGSVSSSGTPLTRGELSGLVADYADKYSTPSGGVFASYRILYAVVSHRKPHTP